MTEFTITLQPKNAEFINLIPSLNNNLSNVINRLLSDALEQNKLEEIISKTITIKDYDIFSKHYEELINNDIKNKKCGEKFSEADTSTLESIETITPSNESGFAASTF